MKACSHRGTYPRRSSPDRDCAFLVGLASASHARDYHDTGNFSGNETGKRTNVAFRGKEGLMFRF